MAVAAAFVTGVLTLLGTRYVTNKGHSGDVRDTPAEKVFEAADSLIQRYREEVDALREEITALRAEVARHRADVETLTAKVQELRDEAEGWRKAAIEEAAKSRGTAE